MLRFRLKFRLRTLLVLVTLGCLVAGCLIVPRIQRATRQQAIIQALTEFPADVDLPPSLLADAEISTIAVPNWMRRVTRQDLVLAKSLKLNPRGLYYPEIGAIRPSQRALDGDLLGMVASLTTLEDLDLHDSTCADNDIRQLKGLVNLKSLLLSRTRVTDDGVAAIASQFPSLQTLDLRNTGVTDESIDLLFAMKSLVSVKVADTQLTLDGLRRIAAHPTLVSDGAAAMKSNEQSDAQRRRMLLEISDARL
ncbi:MAG: hypothetical protein KDB14_28785 [Planctomycetales bacterium]|nr:hypothetical protein [Planctomycetales bacterium]